MGVMLCVSPKKSSRTVGIATAGDARNQSAQSVVTCGSHVCCVRRGSGTRGAKVHCLHSCISYWGGLEREGREGQRDRGQDNRRAQHQEMTSLTTP